MLGVLLFLCVQFSLAVWCGAQDMEVINGTIYVNNEFIFYINGERVAEDPFLGHNAYNVSFTVESGKNITFAINARDWADEQGLEFNGRCVGGGWIRAIFSNGVVTNGSWVCSTYNYGPVNWKDCVAAQTVRSQSLQLFPNCSSNSTPPLVGCRIRETPPPDGWADPGFDDSRWDYALEYSEDSAGYGPPPAGCEDPNTYISSDTDENGVNFTCQNNVNWGDSKFIWRPDLDLDNYVLCRYTLKLEDSNASILKPSAALMGAMLVAILKLTRFL